MVHWYVMLVEPVMRKLLCVAVSKHLAQNVTGWRDFSIAIKLRDRDIRRLTVDVRWTDSFIVNWTYGVNHVDFVILADLFDARAQGVQIVNLYIASVHVADWNAIVRISLQSEASRINRNLLQAVQIIVARDLPNSPIKRC